MLESSAMKVLALLILFVSSVVLADRYADLDGRIREIIETSDEERWSKGKICQGGNDCCNRYNKCGLMEGDCDSNEDCMSGLVCTENACVGDFRKLWNEVVPPSKFSRSDDCCTLPQSMLRQLQQRQLENGYELVYTKE